MFTVLNDPDLPELKVCLETRVGGKSGQELLSELDPGSFFVSKGVKEDILSEDSTRVLDDKVSVKFARVKVSELGFKDIPPQVREVWSRIQSLGLSLCKMNDAIILRLKIKQSIGEVVFVATEQSARFGGIYHLFTLGQYHDSRCLSRILIHPKHKLSLDKEIIIRISEFS